MRKILSMIQTLFSSLITININIIKGDNNTIEKK